MELIKRGFITSEKERRSLTSFMWMKSIMYRRQKRMSEELLIQEQS